VIDRDEGFWRIESTRLTAFFSMPVNPEESKWWETVTGSPPDRSAYDRTSATFAESGDVLGGALQLVLGVQPLSSEWRLAPSAQDTAAARFVGPWPVALPSFNPFMLKWFSGAPPLNRLAFGAVLWWEVASAEDGYSRLSELLPIKVQADWSDFSLQVNKRSPSHTIESLQLNRLTAWSVGRMGMLTIPIPLGGGSIEDRPVFTGCRLSLDINTVPLSAELPHDQLPDLWTELQTLGLEIAVKGIQQW